MTQPTPFTLVPIVESHGPYAEEELGLLLYKGGTVCDDEFSDIAADAICKEMNFERAIVWTTDPDLVSMDRSHYEIQLDNVKCYSPNWKNCSFNEKFNNCHHREDVFLSCQLRGYL